MVGTCVNCSTEILQMNGNYYRPLGNYRSIKLTMENGTKMEIPVCDNCHDGELLNLPEKIYEYVKKCPTSENWTREVTERYFDSFKDLKISTIEKLGSLKAKDLENARIWL